MRTSSSLLDNKHHIGFLLQADTETEEAPLLSLLRDLKVNSGLSQDLQELDAVFPTNGGCIFRVQERKDLKEAGSLVP